jgi:hypothetical protein
MTENKHLLDELEAAISYAEFARISPHAKAVEAAIVDLAQRVALGTNSTCLLIRHADPLALKAYLGRSGRETLAPQDIQASLECPLSLIDAKGRTADQIIEAFRIIHPCAKLPTLKQAKIVYSCARRSGHPEIIDPLLELVGATHEERHKAFFLAKLLENPSTPLRSWLANYVRARFDIEDDLWKKFVVSGIRAKKPLVAAIALERKVDLRPLIEFNFHIEKGHWPVRMQNRISTGHGMMEVMMSMPSLEEIFAMSNRQIIDLVAEPTERQKAKKERQERTTRALAH